MTTSKLLDVNILGQRYFIKLNEQTVCDMLIYTDTIFYYVQCYLVQTFSSVTISHFDSVDK